MVSASRVEGKEHFTSDVLVRGARIFAQRIRVSAPSQSRSQRGSLGDSSDPSGAGIALGVEIYGIALRAA